jgi:hypothetical protein
MARWLQILTDYNVPVNTYRHDAIGWDQCAVGEVHRDFPAVVLVNPNLPPRAAEPLDSHLCRLGRRFATAISANDRKKALKIYDAIQARVRVLVRKAGRRGA